MAINKKEHRCSVNTNNNGVPFLSNNNIKHNNNIDTSFEDKNIISAVKTEKKLEIFKMARKYLAEAIYYESDTRVLPSLINQLISLTKDISELEPNKSDKENNPLEIIKEKIKKENAKTKTTNRKPKANV
jgi:hypothetical protein